MGKVLRGVVLSISFVIGFQPTTARAETGCTQGTFYRCDGSECGFYYTNHIYQYWAYHVCDGERVEWVMDPTGSCCNF
jgi:hypothetical protein